MTAAIFWLKARAGWKEVSIHEHGGVPGQPIEQVHEIRRIILAPGRPAAEHLLEHASPQYETDKAHLLWERPVDKR